MKRSPHYNFRLPQRGAREGESNDAADIEDLTYDLEIVDTELARQKAEDERLEADKATKQALAQHQSAAVLDHPDGSVTDAKIGTRTVLTTGGTLQTLLTAIGSAIKAVSGTSAWNGTPATTLAAAKAHMDSKSNPHGVTKAQVGLGSADNTSDANKPVSTAQAAAIQAVQDDVDAHTENTSNPHGVTKSQVGLGSVPNVSTNNQTPTYTASSSPAALTSGETLSAAFGKLAAAVSALIAHLANKSNPHGVTKAQVGLGSADNTSDANKPVSTAQAAAIGAVQDDVDAHTADTTRHITSSERTNWNAAVSAKHSHTNKSLLDTYTQTEANLASAVSAKHSHSNKSVLDGITSALVSTWNTVSSKLPLAGGTLTGFLTLHAAPTANMHAATKKYVDDKVSAAGGGDMLKSVYDTDGDGVVDNAEKVNGLTVQTAVPAGAKFTDTVYTHPNSGVSAGTYKSVTVNAQGHVTAGSNPTTLSGYGITDAASKSHTHTKSQITDFPSSLKSPGALTIRLNGTSQGAYDGSAAKSINITAAGIGARPSSWMPTPAQIGALPQVSFASYSFTAKQVAAGSLTTFEASYSAAGLPSGAKVLAVNVISTGWGGILPQAWIGSEESQKVIISVYNAGTVARTVGPQIGIYYYEE